MLAFGTLFLVVKISSSGIAPVSLFHETSVSTNRYPHIEDSVLGHYCFLDFRASNQTLIVSPSVESLKRKTDSEREGKVVTPSASDSIA